MNLCLLKSVGNLPFHIVLNLGGGDILAPCLLSAEQPLKVALTLSEDTHGG